MKKIILSLGMVVFAGAVVASGTGAFFNDTETSTGNIFTAGDIDLKIDNTSYAGDCNLPGANLQTCTGVLVASPGTSWTLADLVAGTQKFFNFADLKPGDLGEDTISIHVGSNDAWLCAAARLTSDLDNSITEPEDEVGGPVGQDGTADGDLDSGLQFAFWKDDGDNVYEPGGDGPGDESIFLTGPLSNIVLAGNKLKLSDSTGGAFGNQGVDGGSTVFIGKAWCYGTLTSTNLTQDGSGNTRSPLTGTGFTCDGSTVGNIGQTDSAVGDLQFYAIQKRNNPNFTCAANYTPTWPEVSPVVEVNQNDLFTTNTSHAVGAGDKWFFYDDTADTSMTIDQFAGVSGQNHMESVAGEEGAKMVLHTGAPANPRYNIATAQFGNVLLSSVSSLKFRVYDATADSDTPFLHFNVDFNNTNAFQNRLVMVPSGLPAATWTTVDAINGGTALWTYSGAFWPVGGSEVGSKPGTTAKTWASILADYPNIETLQTGAFLGVRDGQPGPAGATDFVSSIEFNGTTYDFEL